MQSKHNKNNSLDNSIGSLKSIESGFYRFYIENGHYPSALEIDECKYLCTSRYIQMKYGGLKKIRAVLGLDITDFGKGDSRSVIGKKIVELSNQSENMVKEFLINRYGELCVHEEPKIGYNKQRLDFFVYAKQNFGVDVFNTYRIHNFIRIINIKAYKYKEYPYKLFFIVTGDRITMDTINLKVSHKINKLPSNIQCITFDEFKKECFRRFPPLNINIDYSKRYSLL